MEELLNESGFGRNVKVGEDVEGVVVSVKERVAFVDIQTNTEAEIYLEYYTKDKSITSFKEAGLKVGDTIKAKVTKVSREGARSDSTLILLSCLNMLNEKALEEVKAKLEANEAIEAKVTKANDKAFDLDYNGVRCYMPKALAGNDVKVGDTVKVLVVSVDNDGKRTSVKVSQRAILDMEYQENRAKEIDAVNEGDVLTGTIIKIEKYGALVKFNHATGLLKVSEVSHKFVDITKELTIGQEVTVKVIKKENGKLDLSIKALTLSPFKAYTEAHKVSDTVKGKLTNKLEFGLLIELADDVKGLLHRTEFSYNPNDNFANCVKIGDEIEVAIVAIDENKEKISLSRKPLLDNPWARVDAKAGDKTEVTVKEINEKGLLVDAFGVDGFIPASEACDKKDALKDEFSVGDKAEAVVLEINPRRWQLKLSIKKVEAEKARKEFEKHMTTEVESATIGDALGENK